MGDSKSAQGPRLKYVGKTAASAKMYYEAIAPNEEGIYNMTTMPWAPGLSWMRRIEIGIPGLSRFYPVDGQDHVRSESRSGGGIQVKSELNRSEFRPVKYLSEIIDNFLKNVASAKI